MKKLFYIFLFMGTFLFSSCSDELETFPTDMVSGEMMLSNADGAQSILNGVYRAMYSSGWGSSWLDENSGIMAYNLVGDLMAEDHIMADMGNGWFFYDYVFMVGGDYSSSAGRQYQTWNFFYTIIANVNEIIAKDGALDGDEALVNAVLGQAYTMRAFAYYYLINYFQQSILVDNTLPGVPLYVEPTTIETEGKPRGTIQEVYNQINTDITRGVALLDDASDGGWVRDHESNVDFFVASGIKARIDLAQGHYADARDAAMDAVSQFDPTTFGVASISQFSGWNSKLAPNVLWALEVISDQSEHYRGFFSHMDADAEGMYAQNAVQCVSSWLYEQIPSTDSRKDWWRGSLNAEDEIPMSSMFSYAQIKFRFANASTRTGDYLIMRAEEMILIAAEAECHLGNYLSARNFLSVLGEARDSDYSTRLATFTDVNTYNENTTDDLVTLMDEILFQRRVELWGEIPRLFDLKRLDLGVCRSYVEPVNNHTYPRDFPARSPLFTQYIPQAEFDGNTSLTDEDQNP